MSKIHREQRELITIDENTTSHVDVEGMKKKLKLEIRLLKIHIYQQMNSDTISFKDVCIPQNDNTAGTFKRNPCHLPDTEAEIQEHLYSMAGFWCKRMGNQFVFAFESCQNSLHSDKNLIELYKIEEHWQLGKWVMPLSVDIQDIFSKYTVDSAASMKLFLRECKHTLDCYHRREYEFMNLKAFLLDLGTSRVSLQTTHGYTIIYLGFVKAVCQSPEEARYIMVILKYRKQEARPFKVIFDCQGENPLSNAETKVLKVLFKGIREQSLKEAVEKVLASDESPFIRKEDSQDVIVIDENEDQDSDGETSFLKILKKDRKPKKKQSKNPSKNDENDNEVTEGDDRDENDLTIDASDRSNAESNEEDRSQLDIANTRKRRSEKLKGPKTKSLKKMKTNVKSEEKSKTLQAIGKKSLPFKNRNDGVSNSDQNDGKAQNCGVPDIFKSKGKKKKGFLEEVNEADIQLQKATKKIKKNVNSGNKTRLLVDKSTATPAKRSHNQLTCSTPIVGRPDNLSTVAEENISAIVKENRITATEITAIEKIHEASAHSDSDESNLDESGGKDITKVENSQRELLKDLQAVKDNATVTKKDFKRKSKSLARGKKKVPRK